MADEELTQIEASDAVEETKDDDMTDEKMESKVEESFAPDLQEEISDQNGDAPVETTNAKSHEQLIEKDASVSSESKRKSPDRSPVRDASPKRAASPKSDQSAKTERKRHREIDSDDSEDEKDSRRDRKHREREDRSPEARRERRRAESPASDNGAERIGYRNAASRENEDESSRKIFVGGLSWETTVADVKEYFNKYGNVLDCTLKTDPTTGKSRGFAFVLFEEAGAVDKVFNESIHMLNGRKIDPKKALARGGRDQCKKVFVGGLPPDFPVEDIREYFTKYGRVVEIEQPFDRQKNQRRAFIFITFESEDIVEQVIATPKQTIGGREVDVRKATPKSDQDSANRGRGGYNNRGAPAGRADGYPGGPPGYAPPPGYDYYSYYGAYPGYPGYPPGYGYDYSAYGYDYSAYYSQQPPADWSAYSAAYAAAPAAAPAGYSQPPYAGYDYSSWYGTDPAASSGSSAASKAKSPYPYSR